MGNFKALIHNENIKIYSRARTWIMLIILAVFSITIPALMYFNTHDPASRLGVWDSFQMIVSIVFFLNTIFVIVIAADSVAGEFTWGTIKMLLIRPWSRSQVLLSKYISVILYSLLCTAVMVVFALAASFIFAGTSGNTMTAVGAWGPAEYSFMDLLCRYVTLFLTFTIAFMISTVFRASGLAIGLSMFMMFAQSMLAALLNPAVYKWANYLIFTHMNLSGYMGSDVGPGGSTLGFSITVLVVYYVLIMAISWIVFRRRDVAGG